MAIHWITCLFIGAIKIVFSTHWKYSLGSADQVENKVMLDSYKGTSLHFEAMHIPHTSFPQCWIQSLRFFGNQQFKWVDNIAKKALNRDSYFTHCLIEITERGKNSFEWEWIRAVRRARLERKSGIFVQRQVNCGCHQQYNHLFFITILRARKSLSYFIFNSIWLKIL